MVPHYNRLLIFRLLEEQQQLALVQVVLRYLVALVQLDLCHLLQEVILLGDQAHLHRLVEMVMQIGSQQVLHLLPLRIPDLAAAVLALAQSGLAPQDVVVRQAVTLTALFQLQARHMLTL